MKRVYLRVDNYKDFEVLSTDEAIPIEKCKNILREFCEQNNIDDVDISKISYDLFKDNVYIYCKLNIDDLRNLKINNII